MSITGTTYGLDLGTRCGIAFGVAGKPPTVTALRLKKPGDHRAVAFGKLQRFLVDAFEQSRPALVAKESMLHMAALAKLSGGSDDNIRMHAGLHAVVEAVCWQYDVPWTEAADSTIRRHFIGKAKLGDRVSTKAAVVARCHLLGLMPKDCHDDNLADALACHNWATATYCGRAADTRELFMFGEQVSA